MDKNCLTCKWEPKWKIECFDDGTEHIPLHGTCRYPIPKGLRHPRLGWHKPDNMIVSFTAHTVIKDCPKCWTPKEDK